MRGLLLYNRTIKCRFCNKEIVTHHSTQCYCEKKCKWRFENRERFVPKDNRVKKICIWCKKQFFPNNVKHPHQKMCSVKCRSEYNAEQFKGNSPYNPEKEREYYEKHRVKIIARKLAYRKTLHGREVYHNCARRYSNRRRKYLEDSQLSTKEVLFLRERDNNKCVYCQSEKRLTIDHVLALKKGGKDEINNTVIACWNCNSSKKETDVVLWCQRKKIEVPKIILELLNLK